MEIATNGLELIKNLYTSDPAEHIATILDTDPTLLNRIITTGNARWGDGTLIHFAARWGRVDSVKMLLNRGASISIRFKGGRSISSRVISYDGYTAELFAHTKLKSTQLALYRMIEELFIERRIAMLVFDRINSTFGKKPVFGGHRGGSGPFGPENTLFTLRKCVELGIQLLEVDLQLSQDGHIVLIHDFTLDRTTLGSGKVSDYKLEQLQLFAAVKGYPEHLDKGIKIPSLLEVLDSGEFNNVIFIFDCKDKATAVKVLELVVQRNLEDRVILASNASDANHYLMDNKPPTIPLIADSITSTKVICGLEEPVHDVIACSLEKNWIGNLTTYPLNADFVAKIHQQGRKVAVFKVPDAEAQMYCFSIDVDFIITDRPDILLQTIENNKD
jgi:glycerophosphoryl diester phosphodiesterase